MEFEASRNNIMIAVGVAIVFAICAILVYYYSIKPGMNPDFVENKECVKGGKPAPEATLFFFGTSWCPHCKTGMVPWEAYTKSIGGNKSSVNGVVINFREVDCDKEPKIASQYGIKGYPTIKFERGDKVVEFDSKPSLPLLTKFVDEMTRDK